MNEYIRINRECGTRGPDEHPVNINIRSNAGTVMVSEKKEMI